MSPDFVAYVNRADFRISTGDVNGAMDDYSKAIYLNPNDYRGYQNRGVACFKNNRFKEAMEDMDAAINLSSENAAAYYVRGMCKIKLHLQDSGCADLMKSKDLNFSLAQEQCQLLCK